MISTEIILFAVSGLFILSILISKAGSRFGVPILLLFLGIGMSFDIDVLDFINYKFAQIAGMCCLGLILFSGGLNTKITDIKLVARQGLLLSTLGVVLTTVLGGFFIWYVASLVFPHTRFSLLMALLLAAVMSSTDSASVFAMLRSQGVELKHNLRPLLEFECGSNDPMAYMLTVTFIQLILSGQELGHLPILGNLILQLLVGAVLGYMAGKASVYLMNNLNLDNEGLYTALLVSGCFFVFSVTNLLKGNGFLAVYVAGVVIGNARFVMKNTSIKFFNGLEWMCQISIFLILGLLVRPADLGNLFVPGALVGVFMILVARPLAVAACLLPYKRSLKDIFFVSWVGLKGAVPIIFAILPLMAGVPYAQQMFNTVFLITLFSLLVQGSSIAWVAKKLHLSTPPSEEIAHLKEFDFGFGDDLKSILTEVTISPSMTAAGKKIVELNIPPSILIVMVKRHQKYFIPTGSTELLAGDALLFIGDNQTAIRKAIAAFVH